MADPVLDAVVFDMTNAITKRDYGRASELLGQLLKKQEEPFVILAVISKELRRIYTARIALDNGKDKLWLMELWGMRSDYPARLLMEVVQPEPSHVSAARPAHEERKRYRQRGRAQAAADAPCTGEVNLWQSRR